MNKIGAAVADHDRWRVGVAHRLFIRAYAADA